MHTNVPPSPSATLPNPGDYVSTDEAARILGVSRQTLCNWRWKRQGPRVHKVGPRLVRYHRADLEKFITGDPDHQVGP